MKYPTLRRTEAGPWVRGIAPSESLGRFNPLDDDGFDVRKSFLAGGTISCATRQLRHFSDEGLVFVAPVQNGISYFVIRLLIFSLC